MDGQTDIQTDGDYIKRVVHGPSGDHTLKNWLVSKNVKLSGKSQSVDTPSPNPSLGSPPIPLRASGIYRRGVYVNNDHKDKTRQKFQQKKFQTGTYELGR